MPLCPLCPDGVINMFSTNTRELGTRLTSRQLAFAQRDTINALAFETRRNALDNVQASFTLRNKFTERSILVEKARYTTDSATVGSTQKYMLDQEFGGQTKDPTIPTAYSAGQTNTRTRMPRKANRMKNIRLPAGRTQAQSKRQRNLLAVKAAKANGDKFVYIDTGSRKFIARVVGTKRLPKIKMVQDMSRTSTPIPRTPWLNPATDKALRKREAMYRAAMRYQLSQSS